LLILPAEQKVNWHRPPLATLVIIVLNIIIFFNLHSQDNDLWREAYRYYVDNGLPEFEAPEYSDYLQRVTNTGKDSRKDLARQVSEAVNEGRITQLIPVMLEDRQFVNYMQTNGINFIAPEIFSKWQHHRMFIETRYLSQLSYWSMWVIPADIQLPDLLSYQFLHANIEHLLSNMIMLFLVGFAVEMILGKALYLIVYLATGAVGGLLFAFTESSSMTPLVGASASISGLMGIYVMNYRLQKIRFFYFVVVYFNYFRAPALLILPVWLGKEIYEFIANEGSTVAYMAHIGGLLAGAAIMWPWVHWYRQSSMPELTEEELDMEYRENKGKALQAVSQVEFDKARIMFAKLHERFPQDNDIALHLFHLYKLHPDDPECQHFAQLTMDTALTRGHLDQAFKIWEEYQKYSKGLPLSDFRYDFRLLTGCFNSNRLKEAEVILDKITATVTDQNLLIEAYNLAVQTFTAQQMQLKTRKYQKRLAELSRQKPPLLT
jgi:membrane associated rhomboid family serine protease